jgi:hypothetical protein
MSNPLFVLYDNGDAIFENDDWLVRIVKLSGKERDDLMRFVREEVHFFELDRSYSNRTKDASTAYFFVRDGVREHRVNCYPTPDDRFWSKKPKAVERLALLFQRLYPFKHADAKEYLPESVSVYAWPDGTYEEPQPKSWPLSNISLGEIVRTSGHQVFTGTHAAELRRAIGKYRLDFFKQGDVIYQVGLRVHLPDEK